MTWVASPRCPGVSVQVIGRPARSVRRWSLVVKPPRVKRGFVLLPRRWVVERGFAWLSRFRRLARNQERLAEVLEGFQLVAVTMLMPRQALPVLTLL